MSSNDAGRELEPHWDNATFSAHVHSKREEIIANRMRFALWSSNTEMNDIPGGLEFWYGEPPYYVKVAGTPGTLAWDILRQTEDLPRYNCDLEIIGDLIRETDRKPPMVKDDDVDPDLEDCTDEVAKLAIIDVNPDEHFVKKPTYKQEIRNLLMCRGNPYIVQLLGRSQNGELVFPKYEHDFILTMISNQDRCRVENIKRWMMEIIDGVAFLHSLNIVHRDLVNRNILAANPLVICDLQCLNASYYCRAPELGDGDYSKFSFASDVFALGMLLWSCCFYNNPPNKFVLLDNPPPVPFRDIFLACIQENPKHRPTIQQLREMYQSI